ncbi:LysR family transcriptional regulator [Peribacillus frigoritolerans]|uniref:LysR family transcriptional regulator n=1 Tax=Peribacillus frigoritolerans TaxID=450367 RepID=UPI0013E38519|nr:LysR family transcriptional regulator [Peribacillus frigoritolerans]
MDFRHLQYVITVAEERSFSKAAQRLFIAQPSLSQFIKKVESDLQVQIFDRSKTPILLTKEGKLFVERSKTILRMYEETKIELHKLSRGTINKVTIGAPLIMSNLLLPDLLNDYKMIDPPVKIIPVESSSQELEELMEKGKIDFSIITVPTNHNKFHYEPIVSEQFIYALPKNHPLVDNDVESLYISEGISSNKLNDFPLLLTKNGGVRSILNHYFEKNDINPNIVFESKNLDTILSLVNAGLGISIVPKMFMEREFKWKSLDIKYAFFEDHPPEITLGIAYKKGKSISPMLKETIEITKRNLLIKYR